ncbi:hypothetical protein J3R30DRAFT_2070377 [Lentinula aciculospora]|uniref:Uncharacterized protein n=1 Tax=Lentinula aciculospora TaxID=153920 RepID=A0A9W9DFQ1_9AGAR|nr:hypothetical protein J3R30DRAFT_2070377 [Lentinula aciculospora]
MQLKDRSGRSEILVAQDGECPYISLGDSRDSQLFIMFCTFIHTACLFVSLPGSFLYPGRAHDGFPMNEISSQTATSSSSSSSTTTDDNPDTGSFFTPTSSPPLILAFLAIGLLATAIIAALGWRHAYFSRFRPAVGRQMHRGQAQKAQMDIGSKPKLWDLWTTSDAGAISRELAKRPRMNSGTKKVSILNADQDIKWETIMPISVTPLIREKRCSK